jgi:hypothetical protein
MMQNIDFAEDSLRELPKEQNSFEIPQLFTADGPHSKKKFFII